MKEKLAPPNVASAWRVSREDGTFLMTAATIASLAAFLLTRFVVTPLYEARATLRPIVQQDQLSDLMGPLFAIANPIGGAAGLFAASQQTDQAEEYISILTSYDFTMRLMSSGERAAHLRSVTPGLLEKIDLTGFLRRSYSGPDAERYRLYKRESRRFTAEFDNYSNNLELSYRDQDPAWAKSVLAGYIRQLREELRQQEIQQATIAFEVLKAEASKTTDPVMSSEISQLAGHQLERLKLATVETSFAFKIIQNPVVPDYPATPNPILDSVVAGLLGFLASASWIYWHRRLPDPYAARPMRTKGTLSSARPQEQTTR